MNRDFLKEYEAKEFELHTKAVRDFLENQIDNVSKILSFKRFGKLNQPVAYSEGSMNNHYSIIPFYGTTIIPLYPSSKEQFKNTHGLDISDIDNLIDFIKDTGKIQFVLESNPTHYIGLDYFDPIFTELKPPLHTKLHPQYFIPKKEFNRHYAEFDVLASVKFKEDIFRGYSDEYSIDAIWNIYNSMAGVYMCLKYMGHDELNELILNLLMEQKYDVIKVIEICDLFITRPKVETMDAIPNFSKERIDYILSIEETKKIAEETLSELKFPYEIGTFLVKKLTHNPGNFSACLDIIDYYDQLDLKNLMDDLNTAVRENKFDYLIDSTKELENVLDNIWKEAESIKHGQKIVEKMIPISISLIGGISAFFGFQQGLIASLGFIVAEKIFDIATGSIAEKIAKFGYENYLIGIFDFKKKYRRIE